MRITGYCTVCRKIRPVRCTFASLAGSASVPKGVCATCEEKRTHG